MAEDTLELARAIVDLLEQKKGEDIVLLELKQLCSFTDYFIICSAGSERTMKALANELQKAVKMQYAMNTWGVEGESVNGWILLDYGDVIVHLFSPVLREYYQLEELWRDARVLVRIH